MDRQILFDRNTTNAHGGFINKKIHFQVYKNEQTFSYTITANPLSVKSTCRWNHTPMEQCISWPNAIWRNDVAPSTSTSTSCLNKGFSIRILMLGMMGLDNPLSMLSLSPTVPLVDRQIFFDMNTPNVNGGFINKKYIFKYIKMSKIRAIQLQWIHCQWNQLVSGIVLQWNSVSVGQMQFDEMMSHPQHQLQLGVSIRGSQ